MTETVLDVLEKRGLVESTTTGLRELLKSPIPFYIGFDPTADSLHLGNLLGLICLGWFQRFGHRPIVLVGGATGLIGDPSGKSTERPLLKPEDVEHNIQGIKRDLECVLDFGLAAARPIIVNNYDWFKEIGWLEFLRDIGRSFRLGPMLGKEMVRNRLASDEGISYTEFSYQILQAYDFLHLFDNHGVVLEIGGSDQWGNITAGVELVRKLRNQTTHGMTFPLLTRSDGKKFGKSESGTIWLSAKRLSPYEFYQYLIRLPDADITRLMRFLTYMGLEEIHEWGWRMQQPDYVPNSAQRRLAEEVTRLVHGAESLAAAQVATEIARPGALSTELTVQALSGLQSEVPTVKVERHAVVTTKITELLVMGGLASSRSEGRRLIEGGGVSINNGRVLDAEQRLAEADLIEGQLALLAVGKKRKVLIQVEE